MILPGLVDPESGVIRYMPHIAVENWGLVGALEKRFNVTCYVGHDIRSPALAEHYFGASQDCEDSIWCACTAVPARASSLTGAFLLAGTATSAKLATFRSIRWASAATAATSAVWRPSRPMPPSNQRVRHLLEQGYQSRLTPDDCTIKTICKAANKGDAPACEVIEYVGRHLGKTIAIAINLFNPQKSLSPAK